MNKNIFLLLLSLLIGLTVIANQKHVDSIKVLITNTNNKIELAKLNLELGWKTKYDDLDHSISLTTEALKTLTKANDLDGIGTAYSYLGTYKYFQNELAESIKLYIRAEKLFLETGNQERLARLYNNLGINYSSLYDNGTALDYYNKGLTIKKNLPNATNITANLINISSIYYELGEYKKCIHNNEQALIIALQSENYETIAIVYANLGAAYERIGDYNKSINYSLKALDLYQNYTKNDIAEIRTYSNLGSTYMSQGLLENARHYFQLALELNSKMKLNDQECIGLNNMAELERQSKNYKKALNYASQALILDQKIGNMDEMLITLNTLHSIELDLNNHKKALDYYKQYITLSDSLMDISNQLKIKTALIQNQVLLAKISEEQQQEQQFAYDNKIHVSKLITWFTSFLIVIWLLIYIFGVPVSKYILNTLNIIISFLAISIFNLFLFLRTNLLLEIGALKFFSINITSIIIGVIISQIFTSIMSKRIYK